MGTVMVVSLLGFLMNIFTKESTVLKPVQLLEWQEIAFFQLPPKSDPTVEGILQQYLRQLSRQGISPQLQGVWIQGEADWTATASHQGEIPRSGASLTKIATTVAALEKWQPSHQFVTQVYGTGSVTEGVLEGDLIVVGGEDPLFVWEEAIALGNALNQLGIRQVTGNLVVTSNFIMNFQTNASKSGQLFRKALHENLWSGEVQTQYQTLPPNTPRPQVEILGSVVVGNPDISSAQLWVRHQSLPLVELLKQMNIYSNNVMAQLLADAAGGAKEVARLAAKAASVPPEEIQLINGSGLGVNNRISPRAACAMLQTIDQRLAAQNIGVDDLFPVSDRDRQGTMLNRRIPPGTTVKTGTLAQVSALAGVLPTRDRGRVWFAIINQGSNIEGLRQQQDQLLQNLSQHWQLVPLKHKNTHLRDGWFGDPSRNLLSNQ